MTIIDLRDKNHKFSDIVKQDEVLVPENWPGDEPVERIVLHSNDVQKGDIFLAIPPLNQTQLVQDHIAQAIKQQAKIIMTEGSAAIPEGNPSCPIVTVENIRRLRAAMAARIFKGQPKKIVGVTGTNGKTSVVDFARQLWDHLGYPCASIGTLGVRVNRPCKDLPDFSLTSPGPFELHQALACLRQNDVMHVALECSSHGLHQHRLDGVDFTAAAFTNLSHDHLDYHTSMENYFDAKKQLFARLLPEGETAILNADTNYYDDLAQACKKRGIRVLGYGKTIDEGIRLENLVLKGTKQEVTLVVNNRTYDVELNFIGKFQVLNALAALGLVMATGVNAHDAVPLLTKLRCVPGRLELVGTVKSGGAVYVDYAHTPDALSTLLISMRPYVGGVLTVIFGAGGDRDPTKRPLMAQSAAQYSDFQVITDDNPRTEDPAKIRSTLMKYVTNGKEIADRKAAIEYALKRLTKNDACVIAGKGHEETQTIGAVKHLFSDRDTAREIIRRQGGTVTA